MELMKAKDLREETIKAKDEKCKKYRDGIINGMIRASKAGTNLFFTESHKISPSFEKELRDSGYIVLHGVKITRISW